MTSAPGSKPAEFDAYADNYFEALEQGIRMSGEDSDFFASGRVDWVARRLDEFSVRPASVLDFGCGTGSATPYLLRLPGVERVTGSDISEGLLQTARREHAGPAAQFLHQDDVPAGSVDLAFCNGVFHHIPPDERAGAIEQVRRSLKPGGLLAFWENNPWNPGTRLVMRQIPFDRDAIMLSAPESRRLLTAGGLHVLRTHFLFVFPAPLAALRPLEPRLARLPVGAQYVVLAQSAPGVP